MMYNSLPYPRKSSGYSWSENEVTLEPKRRLSLRQKLIFTIDQKGGHPCVNKGGLHIGLY